MDMSKIQRALGFIEGVCIGLKEKEAELIEGAIVEIDCELENFKNEGRERIATPVCGLVRNDSGSCERAGIIPGFPKATVKLYKIEKEDYLSTFQMEELEERLQKHFTDYINGKTQNFELVCCDCVQALIAITQLKEQLKDAECGAYLRQP